MSPSDSLNWLAVAGAPLGPTVSLCAAAAMLGLLGAWHCSAMCAPLLAAGLPTCGARGGAGGARSALGGWALARCGSYALAGAAVAVVWGLLGDWVRGDAGGAGVAAGRSLLQLAWTWGHAAVLAWGLALLLTGRAVGLGRRSVAAVGAAQPVFWMKSGSIALNQGGYSYQKDSNLLNWAAPGKRGWHPLSAADVGRGTAARAARPWGAQVGWLWALLPCPTLYGALGLAALANGPLQAACVMLAFAVASLPGLLLPLWAWGRAAGGANAWALRASGGVLALASAVGLSGMTSHQLWAWCVQRV